MKWTRTEEIEFDLAEMPDAAYHELTTELMDSAEVSLDETGAVYMVDTRTDRKATKERISELVQDYVGYRGDPKLTRLYSPDGLQVILEELEKARAIVLAALTQNAELRGRPLADGPA